jgi:hypothetical protein
MYGLCAETWDLLRAKRRAKKAEISKSIESVQPFSVFAALEVHNQSLPAERTTHSVPTAIVNSSSMNQQTAPPLPPRVPLPPRTLRMHQRESILHYLPPLTGRDAQTRLVFFYCKELHLILNYEDYLNWIVLAFGMD